MCAAASLPAAGTPRVPSSRCTMTSARRRSSSWSASGTPSRREITHIGRSAAKSPTSSARPRGREGVDQPPAARADRLLQHGDPARREGAADRGAQAAVVRRVHAEQHRQREVVDVLEEEPAARSSRSRGRAARGGRRRSARGRRSRASGRSRPEPRRGGGGRSGRDPRGSRRKTGRSAPPDRPRTVT